jgi:uncharacterized membrane protein (UPF0127 family)
VSRHAPPPSRSVFPRIACAVVVAIASAQLVLTLLRPSHKLQQSEMRTPDGTVLHLVVADTATDRAKGLSLRPDIPLDGLLLLWPESAQHPIWMSQMSYPLDLIWCDETGRIIAIKSDVPACSSSDDCPLYGTALQNSRLVIELRAGRIRDLGLHVSEHLSIQGVVR